MSMEGKIISRDGKLYVQYVSPHENEPMITYMSWLIVRTTGNPYHASRPTEGDTVKYKGSGEWYATSSEGSWTGSVSTGDGTAQADHVSTVSAPDPKNTRVKETRWYRGRWEKLLKKGWVPA